jgi:ParB family transcriptional regulator, chromosome partitioning protein
VTATVERLDIADLAETGPPEAVRLPLELIDANPQNPRRSLVELDALADNIKTFGLLQPVTVRRIGERYELLGGHRRRAAFLKLREIEPYDVQWRTIPAVVRSAEDDDRAFLMLLSSQVHNRNWHAREEAAALERLVLGGRTLMQVGEVLNRTEGWASRRLRVYADSILSGYVLSEKLAAATAEQLLPVLDPTTRKQLAERAVEECWTQDKTRGEVRALRLDRQIREIAKRARELLEILSQVDPSRLPPGATKDLWTLRGRIDRIGRGGAIMPSIEQAERAAHVDQKKTPRRRTRLRIE